MGGSGGAPQDGGEGQTSVTTAGTSVIVLSSGTETDTIYLTADNDNTGEIWLGFTSGDMRNGGLRLEAGQGVAIRVNHRYKPLYVDATNSDDKVNWTYTAPGL